MSQREVLKFIKEVKGGTLHQLAEKAVKANKSYTKAYIWSHIQNLIKNDFIKVSAIERETKNGPRKVGFYSINRKGRKFLIDKSLVKTIVF